jgi:hypothetical protein
MANVEMSHGPSEVYLDFYGCVVKVVSTAGKCVEDVRRDFSHFVCSQPPPGAHAVTIRLHRESPPPVPARARRVFRTRQAVCYEHERIRYVDYPGRALVRYDFDSEEAVVFSLDDDLLHEVSYLVVLSRVGELLDKKGIHRIHSLGVSVGGSAAICLLPTGGGKTTLALELVKEKDCALLSDEIAAIDQQLRVLPFPLRIGVRAAESIPPDTPARYLRPYRTISFGSKTLIDLEYFAERIAREPAGLRMVLLGERATAGKSGFRRASKVKALYHVLRHITFAYQLPRTKAYILRFERGYMRTLPAMFLSRIVTGLRIALSIECYCFRLSDHPRENAMLLATLMREKTG